MSDAPYDLAVVGAGVLGLMTALLARRRHPGARIAVIDRSVVGTGATGRSAFLDLPFGHTETIQRLSRESRVVYDELSAELPDFPMRDLPMVGVCARQHADRITQQITQQSVRRDSPTASLAGAPAGFEAPPGSVFLEDLQARRFLDGELTRALSSALESSPETTLLEGAEVAQVVPGRELFGLSLRDGRSLRALRVAVCIGPWMVGGLARMTGFAADLRVKKVVSMLLPLKPHEGASVVYLFDHDAFLMPQPERWRWLFSFRSEEWDCDPDSAELRLSADDLERSGAILSAHFPGGPPTPLGARVFCDGYTPTRDPVIAPITERSGAVAIGGPGGSGVRLAPAIAERALQRIGL